MFITCILIIQVVKQILVNFKCFFLFKVLWHGLGGAQA